MSPAASPDHTEARRRLVDSTIHAKSLRLAGDYPAAADVLRCAIDEAEPVLGPDAFELVVPLNELGLVGKASGEFTEAERVYVRALAIHDGHGRSNTTDTAVILHNLAGLAHARGDAGTAQPLARRGIAVRLQLGDLDPVGLAADRAALAAILIDLGQLAEARAVLTEILAGYERDPGPNRYEIAVTLHNLGALQFREASFADAEATLVRAHRLKSEALGRRHPDLAITLYNLACCQEQLGKRLAARRHLKRAVRVLAGVVDDNSPILAACRNKLAIRSATSQ
jgi:tetratricopeptide (TPR) repeat protein